MRTTTSALFLLLAVAPASAQTTWFADAAATPPGDGSAAAPFPTIQAGIDAASDGDTVLAAAGTYLELLDFSGKAITVRGADSSTTIVDGSDAGPVVTFDTGEGADSRLEDLGIVNGLGQPTSPGGQALGGGLYIVASSPTIAGCALIGNGVDTSVSAGTLYGGGAYVLDGSPTFVDTTFNGNVSCSGGGGVALCGSSSPTFDGCTFSFNVTNSFPGLVPGGAVYSVVDPNAPPVFSDCTFEYNLSDRGGAIAGPAHVLDSTFSHNQSAIGGAVYEVTLLEGCLLTNNNAQCYFAEDGLGGGAAFGSTLRGCSIQGNRATLGGGVLECTVEDSQIYGNHAMYLGNCNGRALGGGAMDSVLVRCTVGFNDVEKGFGTPFAGEGGGLYGGSAEHCLIVDNFADQGGGAANAVLTSCTLVGNGVRLDTGGGYLVTARNCIFWQNLLGELDAGSTATWSLVQGGSPGPGNLDSDPLFESGASGTDYDLSASSPAIDAGDPTSAPDVDASVADLGAFATDQSYPDSPTPYCTAKESSQGCLGYLMWSGTPSLGAPTLRVVAGGVDSARSGLLFFGAAPASIPFLGGTLCVRPPLARTPIQSSGGMGPCGGSFSHTFDLAELTRFGTGPSDSLFAQYWYRDPGAADGTAAGLTNALRLTLLP